jgi:hypothetical protein
MKAWLLITLEFEWKKPVPANADSSEQQIQESVQGERAGM